MKTDVYQKLILYYWDLSLVQRTKKRNRSKHKYELYITNWSYSYKLVIFSLCTRELEQMGYLGLDPVSHIFNMSPRFILSNVLTLLFLLSQHMVRRITVLFLPYILVLYHPAWFLFHVFHRNNVCVISKISYFVSFIHLRRYLYLGCQDTQDVFS